MIGDWSIRACIVLFNPHHRSSSPAQLSRVSPSPQTSYSMDLELYLFPVLYAGLCIFYLAVGINSNYKAVKAVLKCTPIVCLILSAFFYSMPFAMGPIGHQEASKSYERLLYGLVFSCLGDLYLVFPKTFLLGVISFGIALFGESVLMFLYNPTVSEITVAIAIGMVSLFVYFYILPKLNWILIVPFFAYCILISTMLWSAIVKMLQTPNDSSCILGAVGACLFFTSDLVLALRGKLDVPYGPVIVMVTYYSAQLLISLSVITKF